MVSNFGKTPPRIALELALRSSRIDSSSKNPASYPVEAGVGNLTIFFLSFWSYIGTVSRSLYLPLSLSSFGAAYSTPMLAYLESLSPSSCCNLFGLPLFPINKYSTPTAADSQLNRELAACEEVEMEMG